MAPSAHKKYKKFHSGLKEKIKQEIQKLAEGVAHNGIIHSFQIRFTERHCLKGIEFSVFFPTVR
jgi:hypothetical protein